MMKRGLAISVVLGLLIPVFISSAYALPLEDVAITWGGPAYTNGWLTEYTFDAAQLNGPLAAFCVDPTPANNDAAYELVAFSSDYDPIPNDGWTPDINLVTMMADHFFSTGGLSGSSQSDYQVAIWDALGMINYTGNDSAITQIINFFDGGSGYSIQGPIALARSGGSQNYLIAVPVPEPATLLLLGTGLVGLASVSRRKFKKA